MTRIYPLLLMALLHMVAGGQTVSTQFGPVEGHLNGAVHEFLGIPFARPPVDTLRWKAPLDPVAWTGVFQANAFAPVCPQKRFEQGDTTFTLEGNEDCLYLNLWTPATGPGNRPVMVFLHGGGNQQGGASQISGGALIYSGKNLAERGDVVVVTIQYRLGPLGFLVHPGLELENNEGVAGNYGLMDQILALKWIKNNLPAFGGDTSRIMVFGESAGGVDAGDLLLTPHAKGLFNRACIESACPVLGDYITAREKGIGFADHFITSGSFSQKIAYLRGVPPDSLVLGETSPLPGGVAQPEWGPVVDNYLFPQFPSAAIQGGNFNRMPVLLGSNAEEMSLTAPTVVLPAMVDTLIGSVIPSWLQTKAHALYPSGSGPAEARQSYVAMLTDAQFTATARRTATCLARNQEDPVWRYFFTFRHTIPQLAAFGSYHGMELFYVFNTWENTLLGSGAFFHPADDSVQQVMLKYWVNFAATGNPNGSGLPVWPQSHPQNDCYMEIKATPNGDSCGVRTAACNIWDVVAGFNGCYPYSLPEKDPVPEVTVYPNPTGGPVSVQIARPGNDLEVTVADPSGRSLFTTRNTDHLDLSGYKPGIYFLQIRSASISCVKKITVIR
ncbi:MAG TPA: carboxylesterase family protein [Bacteroidales bacterium]|nr:carboxylesterase family protein [Bacteroidales bacterium]